MAYTKLFIKNSNVTILSTIPDIFNPDSIINVKSFHQELKISHTENSTNHSYTNQLLYTVDQDFKYAGHKEFINLLHPYNLTHPDIKLSSLPERLTELSNITLEGYFNYSLDKISLNTDTPLMLTNKTKPSNIAILDNAVIGYNLGASFQELTNGEPTNNTEYFPVLIFVSKLIK